MNGQFNGKVAVITGSTQGLGAATAKLFAERGAKGLVICGRSVEKGRTQVDQLANLGAKAVFVQADLEKVEDCRKIVSEADRVFGRLDVLVNAAGLTDRGTILDTSPELFDRLFAVNTRAPFFLIQEAIELFRRDKIEERLSIFLRCRPWAASLSLQPIALPRGAGHTDPQRSLFGFAQSYSHQ